MMRGSERLALALDTDDGVEALRWARDLREVFGIAKVGLELFSAEGASIIFALRELDFRVFLDIKMHDIPTTVYRASRVAGGFGVEMVTYHTQGGEAMLRAGVEGLAEGALAAGVKVAPIAIGVTYLTSEVRVDEKGFRKRLALAATSGCGGLVSSAGEVRLAKSLHPDLLAVVPGIRFGESSNDDQARVATPRQALAAGADVLVIGRSMTRASDLGAAVALLESELIASAN